MWAPLTIAFRQKLKLNTKEDLQKKAYLVHKLAHLVQCVSWKKKEKQGLLQGKKGELPASKVITHKSCGELSILV